MKGAAILFIYIQGPPEPGMSMDYHLRYPGSAGPNPGSGLAGTSSLPGGYIMDPTVPQGYQVNNFVDICRLGAFTAGI